ncbi:hypothetical protein MPTK1_7g01220 [Marchantia polymorpha subsp. ruderalis]|uniref:F-box domain-containing protein n=2 Tax=Marchantia polymorpha TaxID=3197 RepID=A0AAF6BUZ4_MARPO|nr:hypothetical protein MARPO_0046s0002 [Marchantia polymorpha]BBN15828.1 hypothetical protein Mp_7g01220 [Marchantia polymorpha subsp. ruderalis]|eukprot:PTQ39177.1 hypothetical protein MARPO_0046s0002 [Marchantia polymorpha]
MDPDSDSSNGRLSASFKRLLCCISPAGASDQVMVSRSTSASASSSTSAVPSIREVQDWEEVEADAQFHFNWLSPFVKNEILGRLSVISIVRSRLVCKTWKELLCSRAFATKHWAKHRPEEKWLTFLDVCNFQEVYFYDAGPNECYKMPQAAATLVRSLPVSSSAQMCYADTSALGLMFVCVLCPQPCGPQVGTIWVLNPLTGGCCQLAASSDETPTSVRSMVAKLDTTTKPRPNYKFLIMGTTLPTSFAPSSSSESRSTTMILRVFSSRTNEWQTLPGVQVPPDCMHTGVKRFHDDEDDLTYVLELYNPGQAPAYGGTLGNLRWLNVVHYEWESCSLPLLTAQHDFVVYSILLFERNNFLILVAIGTNFSGDCVKIRIFESSSSVSPSGAFQWCFRSEMPVDAMGVLIYSQESADNQAAQQSVHGGGLLPQWPPVLMRLKYLQTLPLGKRVSGDQIVFFNFEIQQIVSFRLDSPPSQAWTTPSGFVFDPTPASPSTTTAAGSSSSSSRANSFNRPALASSAAAAASVNLTLPGRQGHSQNTWMANLQSQTEASHMLHRAFAFEPRIDVDPRTTFGPDMSE